MRLTRILLRARSLGLAETGSSSPPPSPSQPRRVKRAITRWTSLQFCKTLPSGSDTHASSLAHGHRPAAAPRDGKDSGTAPALVVLEGAGATRLGGRRARAGERTGHPCDGGAANERALQRQPVAGKGAGDVRDIADRRKRAGVSGGNIGDGCNRHGRTRNAHRQYQCPAHNLFSSCFKSAISAPHAPMQPCWPTRPNAAPAFQSDASPRGAAASAEVSDPPGPTPVHPCILTWCPH